jgi:hypothetical protein
MTTLSPLAPPVTWQPWATITKPVGSRSMLKTTKSGLKNLHLRQRTLPIYRFLAQYAMQPSRTSSLSADSSKHASSSCSLGRPSLRVNTYVVLTFGRQLTNEEESCPYCFSNRHNQSLICYVRVHEKASHVKHTRDVQFLVSLKGIATFARTTSCLARPSHEQPSRPCLARPSHEQPLSVPTHEQPSRP